jgi:glycyl-tRNA synthetase
LVKKDGLPEIAKEIIYEEKDTIGKRYRRMDALGTPYCITIDYQTKEDQTVTIRHRDSMEQQRIPISQVASMVLSSI